MYIYVKFLFICACVCIYIYMCVYITVCMNMYKSTSVFLHYQCIISMTFWWLYLFYLYIYILLDIIRYYRLMVVGCYLYGNCQNQCSLRTFLCCNSRLHVYYMTVVFFYLSRMILKKVIFWRLFRFVSRAFEVRGGRYLYNILICSQYCFHRFARRQATDSTTFLL